MKRVMGLDRGVIVLLGWTKEGRPAFRNRQGQTFLPGASGVPRDKVPRGTIRRHHPAMKPPRKRRGR